MAKRTRLNKRLLVVLALVGFVAIVIAAVVLSRGSGKSESEEKQAYDTCLKGGDWEGAIKAVDHLLGTDDAKNRPEVKADYQLKKAKALIDYALKDPKAAASERWNREQNAAGLLMAAASKNNVEAQRTLCDLQWEWVQIRRISPRSFIETATSLIAMAPDDAKAYSRRAIQHRYLALTERTAEYMDKALADFRKAATLKKDEVDYWVNFAQFADAAKLPDSNPNQPEAIYREALKANPNSAELRVAFAGWNMSRQNPGAARDLIEEAIQKAPQNVQGYLARARLNIFGKKWAEALPDLEKAKEIDPTDPQAYSLLAAYYGSQTPPDLVKAAQCIREGLDRLNKLAATQPSARSSGIGQSQIVMSGMLAEILLDLMGQRKSDDYAKARAEVQGLLDQITQLRPNAPVKYRIAGRLAMVDALAVPAKITNEKIDAAVKALKESDDFFNHGDYVTTHELITAYELQRKIGLALEAAQNFLNIAENQNNPAILLRKARLLQSLRDYPKATECLDKVLKFAPDTEMAKEAKSLRETIVALDNAGAGGGVTAGTDVTKENVRLFQEQANKAWATGNRDGAIELLKDLHRRLPDNAEVTLQLVRAYDITNKTAEARELVSKLIKDAKNEKDKKSLQDYLNQLSIPDPKQRIKFAYNKALELADSQESPKLQKLLYKCDAAMTYGMGEDFVKFLDEAAKIAPTDKGVIDRKFDLALGKRDWKDAQEWAQKATEINADGAKGRIYFARLALAKREVKGAINLLEDVRRDFPNLITVQLMLADCYRISGLLDKSEELYKAINKTNPDNLEALKGLILLCQRPDKRDEWADYVKRAYPLAPGNPFFAEQYQELQEQSMKPEQIIPIREKLLIANPTDLNNIYRLALLYEYIKKAAKAREMYETALQISQDKIVAARSYGQYLLRNKLEADLRKLMDALLVSKADPVAAHGLYADFLIAMQKLPEAQSELDKAVNANTQDPRGYQYKAKFFAMAQKWKEAVEMQMEVLRLDESSRGQTPEKELVSYQINAGQFENARARIDTLLARSPADIDALFLQAKLAMMKENTVGAEESLTKAVTLNSGNIIALVSRADFYVGQAEFAKARADLEAAQKIAPSQTEISIRLARVLMLQYETNKAIEQLKMVLGRDEDNNQAISELVGIYRRKQMWDELDKLLSPILARTKNLAPLYVLKAKGLLDQGKVKEALAALTKARETAPDSQDVLRFYLQTLNEQKMYSEAISEIEKLLSGGKTADYKWLNALMVRSLVGAGQVEKADKLFRSGYGTFTGQLFDILMEQAITAYKPKELLDRLMRWKDERRPLADDGKVDIKAIYYRGNVAIEAGEFDLAEKAFDEGIATAKEDSVEGLQFKRLKAAAYYQRHSRNPKETVFRDKAEKLFLEVIEKSKTSDVQALNNLAYLYVDDMNDPDKALPFAQKAWKLQPDSNVLDTYGWVLARQADRQSDPQKKQESFDKARQILERSMELLPASTNRYHLGWVLEQTGKREEALKLYRLAFEGLREKKTDALYEPVRKAIDRLSGK